MSENKTTSIDTVEARAKLIRACLLDRRQGVASWARLPGEHAGSAPAMLDLIDATLHDVDTALLAMVQADAQPAEV